MTFLLAFIGLIVAYHLVKFFIFYNKENNVPDLSKHGHLKEILEQRMHGLMKLYVETPPYTGRMKHTSRLVKNQG